MPALNAPHFEVIAHFLNSDTNKLTELQEMTELASFICRAPIAMINLMDKDTQHICYKTGTQLKSLQLEDTFCQYLLKNHQDLMVVQDTLRDQRFYDNPLVAGAPYIRSYAGISLRTSQNMVIGSLCVLSRSIMKLDASQAQKMRVLAQRIVERMEANLLEIA